MANIIDTTVLTLAGLTPSNNINTSDRALQSSVNKTKIITLDTTWGKNEVINLTGLVQIAPGVTLTIEEGAIINGNNQTIQTFGTLNATGSANSKIEFNDTRFIFGSDSATPGRIEISHASINEGSFLPATGNGSVGSFSVVDSSLISVDGFYIWYPDSLSKFERNIFSQSDGLSIGTSGVQVLIKNNVFIKQNGPAIENWASYGGINLIVEYNSFLSTDRIALSLPDGYNSTAMLAEKNYFGTIDLVNIEARVYDRSDSLNVASVIDYDPILMQAHADTPLYFGNAAPVLNGVPSFAQSITVGTAASLTDFTVADADADNLTVTLTPTNGTLGGLTDANPSLAGLQLTGTATSINTAITGATFTGSAAGPASIGISITDGLVATPTIGTYNFTAALRVVVPPSTPLGLTDDFVVLQTTTSAIAGAGVGNDTYLLSGSMIPAGKAITISDALGSNSIQLANGLQIASAQVTATALKLNLVNGASITVLGADRFTFEAGGNTTADINQPDLGYSQFVQNVLGVSVPTTGLVTSGAITITISGVGANVINVSGNQVVNATAAAEVFGFNVASALADAGGTNTQATISGFSTANDRLLIDLPTANSSLTRLDQLNGFQGISVELNPFSGATLINFGNDANGGDTVTLSLVGISDPTAVQIQVV